MNPRLLIRDATGAVQEIPLRTGLNRLGRGSDDEIVVDDETVSENHCEIEVRGETVWVRDLHSANGVFLEGQPVQETQLQHGQTLRLGRAEFLYLSEPEEATDTLQIPIPPPLVDTTSTNPADYATPGTPAAVDRCLRHPEVAGPWVCQQCGSRLCADCVKARRVGSQLHYSCVICGGHCVNASQQMRARAISAQTFYQLVPGAFSYPFKKNGLTLMLCGALFFSVLDWGRYLASAAPMLGFFAVLMLTATSVGFLFAYMKSIVSASIDGSDVLPGWPDVSDFWEDLGVPFFQFISILLLGILPGILAINYVSLPVGLVVLVLGVFCLPMAYLTVSLADSLSGLNPVILLAWISRVLGPYCVACVIFLLFMGLRVGFQMVVEWIFIPLVPTLVINFLMLYGLTVEMRVLGLMYYKYRDRLDRN